MFFINSKEGLYHEGSQEKNGPSYTIIAHAVVPLMLVSLTIVTSRNASSDLGTVKEIKKGRIERQQNGVWKALGIDSTLFVHDKVRTRLLWHGSITS